MKKTRKAKNDQPVTVGVLTSILKSELQKVLSYVDKRFDQIDKRFEGIDKRFGDIDKRFVGIDKRFDYIERRMATGFAQADENFAILNGKIATVMAMNTMHIDSAISQLEGRLDKKFDTIYKIIDSSLKTGEKNEEQILFLGHQHDDLAKYCTDKIGYPTYGRNL